jgi:PAS domain S-box-containing protein
MAQPPEDRRFRDLVDLLPEAVYEADATGRFTFVNLAASQLFGYSAAEIAAGLEMLTTIAPEDRALALERIRGVLGGESSPGTEFRARRKDGSTFPASIRSVPLEVEGRVIGLRGVVIDLTERKRVEAALQRQADQLRALAARLTDSVESERKRIARLLHDEIAQNLTAIGFNLAQVEKALPPSLPLSARTRLGEARALSERTLSQTRTLMGDLRPLLLEDLGLAPALRWLGDQFSMRTGVRVIERIDDLDGRRLRVEDEVHLFRIAQELLSNVGRHAQAREVTLSFAAEGAGVRLTVADDGRGFQPPEGSPDGWGGFGLVHARERALAAGGTVSVSSAPGQGTTVIVDVPG